MPGLDLGQLSSNWKKLQVKLRAENKEVSQSNGVKRKRPDEGKPANGYKKTKVSDNRPTRQVKGGKMGMSWSKSEEQTERDATESNLANAHGFKQDDISILSGAFQKHVDDVNGGLHPTHRIGKYVALDCEMVGTGPPPHLDNVLARVSLLNYHGEQIYDSYVSPPPGIVVEDYRTFVSGIRKEHLDENYARPFAQVRAEITSLLEGRILVGHALQNDLRVMMLKHPRPDIRDTSRYPKFRMESGGRPPALRKLAKSELGMNIQTGEHSSIEDARAALLLFRKEREGFEEENRKHFGRHAKSGPHRVKQNLPNGAQSGDVGENDDVEDETEDDIALLDGEGEVEEVDDTEDATTAKSSQPQTRKKRKKKKNTKRK